MELSPLLKVDGLRFHFDTCAVFADFSVALAPGITWLRGANGKGKTTLLKLLAGALAPAAGTVAMNGVDSVQAPVAYRLSSFYCGGESPDLPWLTVTEWIDLHLALYPAANRKALKAQLAAFGILDVLPQAITTLSLGQHKKLQLALALALPVTLLLIDEPFNGLDATGMAHLREELERRAATREACIVLTSHLDPRLPVARTLDLDTYA
jgi:ABC-2 type transport system ATP-binding protein